MSAVGSPGDPCLSPLAWSVTGRYLACAVEKMVNIWQVNGKGRPCVNKRISKIKGYQKGRPSRSDGGRVRLTVLAAQCPGSFQVGKAFWTCSLTGCLPWRGLKRRRRRCGAASPKTCCWWDGWTDLWASSRFWTAPACTAPSWSTATGRTVGRESRYRVSPLSAANVAVLPTLSGRREHRLVRRRQALRRRLRGR